MKQKSIRNTSTMRPRQDRRTAGGGVLTLRLFLAVVVGAIYGHFFKDQGIAAAILIFEALSGSKKDR